MKKLSTGWIIHIFAMLHLGTAVLCRAAGLSDTLLLTLLTMTLTVIICLRERLSLEFTAAAIVLVNILGYFAGVGLAALLNLFIGGSLLQSGLATFLTTELIGWGLWLSARSSLAARGRGNNFAFSDRQIMVLVIGIAVVYIVRVMLDLYSSGAGSRSEIVGNALALLIFVADVIFISRFVSRQVEAEREKGDEARQRYNVLKKHVDSLQNAVEQYRKTGEEEGLGKLLERLPEITVPAAAVDNVAYKERYLVRVGDRIVPVQTSDIACYREGRGTRGGAPSRRTPDAGNGLWRNGSRQCRQSRGQPRPRGRFSVLAGKINLVSSSTPGHSLPPVTVPNMGLQRGR